MSLLTKSGGFLGPIATVLGYVMSGIFGILVAINIPNIGLSIVLFTIVIYMLMLPLTYRQQKFSRMTPLMNPELNAVREKYKGKQDQASMQAVAQLDLKEGDTVLDVCAAPGGKSLQVADELCKLGGGTVIACDISEKKADLIRENQTRCGFDNIQIQVQSALEPNEDYVNFADVLIADLPCSGLGTIGRKADIKYRMSAQQMEELVRLQRQILENVADYVKKGGTLLYSTCTLNPAENEEQAAWIENNLPFQLINMHQIFPGKTHDGFFFAVFRKID